MGQAVKTGRKPFPLMKYTSIALSPRAWQSCWVKTRRASVQAVLRAGPLSGPAAWALSELYLAGNSRDVATELFEQLAFPAGSSGARRIFLRLPSESELFDDARAAGYVPVYGETLYRSDSADDARMELGAKLEGLAFRPLDIEDQHALYRLFCASVPMDTRTKIGQTFEEWSSSRETAGRKSREWGVDDPRSGGIQATVTSCDVPGGRYFSVRAMNDMAGPIDGLIAAGMAQTDKKAVFTLVPSYDQKMVKALTNIGFTASQTYDVMVKTLAVTVAESVPGLAAIER